MGGGAGVPNRAEGLAVPKGRGGPRTYVYRSPRVPKGAEAPTFRNRTGAVRSQMGGGACVPTGTRPLCFQVEGKHGVSKEGIGPLFPTSVEPKDF